MKRRRTVWPAPVAQVIEFHAAIPNALILGLYSLHYEAISVAPQQVLAFAPVGFAKLGSVNSETKVKFSFRLSLSRAAQIG